MTSMKDSTARCEVEGGPVAEVPVEEQKAWMYVTNDILEVQVDVRPSHQQKLGPQMGSRAFNNTYSIM